MSLFGVGEWPLAHLTSTAEPVLIMGIDFGREGHRERALVVKDDGSLSFADISDVKVDFRLIEGTWKDLADLSDAESDPKQPGDDLDT